MAAGKLVLCNAVVVIASVDLSSHVAEIDLTYGAELLDSSGMRPECARARVVGLKDWSATLNFQQDYAAALVNATLFPLVGAAAFAVEFRPTSDAAGATNPSFQGSGLIETYSPLAGSIGEVLMAPVTISAADGVLAMVVA